MSDNLWTSTAEQIKTLEKSIEKWRAILFESGEDHGSSGCECCEIYLLGVKRIVKAACFGCPIKEHTGKTMCYGTPYDDWIAYTSEYKKKHGIRIAFDVRARELALEELELLTMIVTKLRKIV